MIEIPPDTGERLVKRPDVDTDAHPRSRTRGSAKRTADSIGKRMAQSVKDGPEHRMRSLAIFVVILLIIVGAAAVFLVATTPRQSTPVRVSPVLIKDVPASADEFAIIPSAAAFDAKLNTNPITRAALDKWR